MHRCQETNMRLMSDVQMTHCAADDVGEASKGTWRIIWPENCLASMYTFYADLSGNTF